jgi:hypothetical protein
MARIESSVMNRTSDGSSRLTAWAIAASGAVLLWRLMFPGSPPVWKDWMLILAGYGIFASLKSKSPALPMVSTSIVAYLAGIHVLGQIVHLLKAWGL